MVGVRPVCTLYAMSLREAVDAMNRLSTDEAERFRISSKLEDNVLETLCSGARRDPDPDKAFASMLRQEVPETSRAFDFLLL